MAKAKGEPPAGSKGGPPAGPKAETPAAPPKPDPTPARKAEPKPEPNSVLDRLAAVERQNRTLRRLTIGLAVFTVLAVLVAGAALVAPYNAELGFWLGEALGRPEVVEAKKTILEAEQFVLRARDGKVRATLALRGDTAMGLDLYDEAGKARAGIDLGSDGQPNLWLAARDGQITLAFNSRGVRVANEAGAGAFLSPAGLSLVDAHQKSRLGLLVNEDAPSLTLYDREGKPGALLDVSEDGARLGLFYGGIVRAGLGHGRGGSQLNLFSQDGRDHATLSLMPDGSTGLIFHDDDGKQRVALGVLPNVSGLSIFDKGEKQRIGLSTATDDSPRVELFDGAGSKRAGLALSADGLPTLRFEDKGQPRAVLGAATVDGKRGGAGGKFTSTSSLLLFDRDGSLTFQAPVY